MIAAAETSSAAPSSSADPPARRLSPESAQSRRTDAGRYDHGLRRRGVRKGRERGCWVYIPADELIAANIDPDGPPPFYRLWGSRRGSLLMRLYLTR